MTNSVKKTAAFVLIAAGLATAGALGLSPSFAEEFHTIPAPASDAAPSQQASETAILAGGCFWGVQGVFQHVTGVTKAVSGYAGGEASTAQYELVGGGSTGHAEAVLVTFDPSKISYGQILQIYFSLAHDPTQLNRQGPDRGTQYRSAIFPTSDEQARIARAYIGQLSQTRIFPAAIVTKIEQGKTFYPAEAYHQDFLTRNPSYPYIVINDMPKVEALKRMFSDRYREEPVLVSSAATN